MKRIFAASVLFVLLSIQSSAQSDAKGSFGLGVGFDHGGFGAKLMALPSRNLGIFVGVGYAIAGTGFNGGLQGIFNSSGRARGYVIGMYGYNAAIKVIGDEEFNKLYYGPSFGGGVMLSGRHNQYNYWSFGLLIPVRDPAFQNKLDELENMGVSMSAVPPVGISIGFNFGFRPSASAQASR
jgi:hypothetical protein